MRRLAVAMAVAMASGRASALGLGDIELHSALNQPLSAEVRLVADDPKELDGAAVLLAPNDEFVRAGIERPAILSDLKFDIVPDKSGGAVVKITSTQPIRDPFLDFVVQLRWQSGRLLREYTVLLDPPVFGNEQQPTSVAPPATAAAATVPAPQAAAPPVATAAPPADNQAAAAAPSAPVSAAGPRMARMPVPMARVAGTPQRPSAGAASYGPTKRSDTLWNLASELRPDDSVSVYQMMLALLKANPQAFYDSNINNLKAGYVLRVPDKATATAISQSRAVQEAARQYQQWQVAKRGSAASESTAPAAPLAAAAPAADQNPDKESARLRLVAPPESGGATAGGTQAQLDKLRSDLALALESSDSAKRESDELRSRVSTLEEQINSLQRLLTLKDQALSDMQKHTGQVPPAAKAPAPVVEETAASAVSQPPQRPAAAKPKPQPAPPAEAPAPGLMDDPAMMGVAGGAALLLLSLGWLVARRRRGDQAEDEPMLAPAIDDEPAPAFNVRPMGAQVAPVEEELAATGSDDPQMTRAAEEMAQQVEPEIPQTANDLDMMSTSEGEIDPIVEADVYLAYRRYQQAEALVQNALSKQPDRRDLQAKLLDIHYAAKNSESFRKVAESLFINLGSNDQDPMWQRILPMGRELCPESDLFAGHDEHGQDHAAGDEDVFGAPAAGDDKMELDLNMDVDAEPAASAESAPEPEKGHPSWEAESAGSEFGNLDFGLDDGDLLAGTDVVGTKLDLARAYIDMGDNDSARDILKEVTEEGNDQQKHEASTLMEKIA